MATRKNPSLSDILKSFREVQVKTANEELADPAACPSCGGAGCPDCPEAPDTATEDALGAAVAVLENAGAEADAANAEADNAEAELVDAAEALKEVADEFIAEHTDDLAKEAQLFGQLFASSCMEQMGKEASLREVQEQAYAAAASALNSNLLQKCAAETYEIASQSLGMDKQAALFGETYRQVMAKLAGFEDAEEMDEAAGHELSPEELAAIVAAQNEQDEDEDGAAEEALANMSDEEIAALAAQLEGEEGEEGEAEPDPETVAQAAELLSAIRNGEGEEEAPLDDVSGEAYNNTMAALGAE